MLLIAMLVFMIALTTGAYPINISDIGQLLLHRGSPIIRHIFLDLRLPHVFEAWLVGGLLALAGCLMQILLTNPLADPYVLGTSGGAAVANLIAMLLGLSLFWQHCATILGAFAAMMLVLYLARFATGNCYRLLLIGFITAAGFAAIISLILCITPAESLHPMLFWLMGDIDTNSGSLYGMLVLTFGLFISLLISKQLNILYRGELVAQGLGIATQNLYFIIYLLCVLLTATAVTLAGTIGFIGLIIPHIARLIVGTDHRYLLPASVLAGGSLLCFADLLARNLFSPQQIPVGIMTAFIGIPIFLILLRRSPIQ